MNIYGKYLLPRLIDLAMRSKANAAERANVIPRATGVVLEIGIGSGLNLPFYGTTVERLYGVDPSLELWKLADRRLARTPFPVEFLRASAERIPMENMTIDTGVMTWTLCSIPNARQALREMRRVLKPGGRLLFVEHGLASDRGVVAWQNRLDPLWTRVAGGCHLNRKIDDLITDAGFLLSEIDRGYGDGPRPMAYLYRGVARPSGLGQPSGPDAVPEPTRTP